MALAIVSAFGCLRRTAGMLVFLLGACCGGLGQPACNNPKITVDMIPSGYRISGSDFAGGAPCARISMLGLPGNTGASGTIVLGDVPCTGGKFTNFEWQYRLYNCTGVNRRNVSIVATDQKTHKLAVQETIIMWGSECALSGYTQCGGEGEAPCENGGCDPGPPSLHPDLRDGRLICTKNCGHTQGYSPCTPGMDGCPPAGGVLVAPQRACRTKPGVVSVFACFDHSRISNTPDCRCVPNTLNLCKTNISNASGTCTPGSFSEC
jgi:hypothetical protein